MENVRLCAGNRDDELGSLPFFARSRDLPVMGVHQLLNDGQADPTPRGVPDSWSAPKSIEDVSQVLWSNAPTRVFDNDPGYAITGRDGHCDRSTRWSELDGIRQEVGDDLVQSVLVAPYNRWLKIAGQGKPRTLQLRFERFRGLSRDQSEIHGFEFQGQPGGLGRSEDLEVFDDAPKTQSLIVERGQRGRGRLLDAIGQGLGGGLQNGQRGPQLMSNVGDENPS